MINKILSISDLHLRTLKNHHVHKEGFNKLITEAKKLKPDVIVICGDLFHQKITISNESISILAKLLNALKKHCKELIIIPGNHDTILDSNRLDSISAIVETINNPNIHYFKESGCYLVDDIVFCAWSCLEGQKNPEIKTWKEENDPDNEHTYVGLYHGVIAGSKTSQGFSFGDEGVAVNQFYETDFFLAGDIHLYQTYKYENYKKEGFGIMCSTMLQDSFGEKPEDHGYILLNKINDKWSHKLVEIENPFNYITLELTDFDFLEDL